MPKTIGNKKVIACSCGYKSGDTDNLAIKQKTREKHLNVEVVEEGMGESLPLVDEECKKCGHGKAFYWQVQTRAGDEPETRFFRCEKCKHTWRDYS